MRTEQLGFLQVVFLNQIMLHKKGDGPAVAKSLIGLYFGLFKVSALTPAALCGLLLVTGHTLCGNLLLQSSLVAFKQHVLALIVVRDLSTSIQAALERSD